MTEDQIKYMAQRFLGWKLPENFIPDCGIHFDAEAAMKMDPRNGRYEPTGTNLFDARQAQAMVRYMVDGMLDAKTSEKLRRIEEGQTEDAELTKNEDTP